MPPKATANKKSVAARPSAASGSNDTARALMNALTGPTEKLPTQLKLFEGEEMSEELADDVKALKELKVLDEWGKRLEAELSKSNWTAVSALYAVCGNLCTVLNDEEGKIIKVVPRAISEGIKKALHVKEDDTALQAILKALHVCAEPSFDEVHNKPVKEAMSAACMKVFQSIVTAEWSQSNMKQLALESISNLLTTKTKAAVDVQALMKEFQMSKNPFVQFWIVNIVRVFVVSASAGQAATKSRDETMKIISDVLGRKMADAFVDLVGNPKDDENDSVGITKFLMHYHTETGSDVWILPCNEIKGEDAANEEPVVPEDVDGCFVSFSDTEIGFPMAALDLFNNGHPPGQRHMMFPMSALRGVNKGSEQGALAIGISERYATKDARQMPKGKVTFILVPESKDRMKKVIKSNMPIWKAQMAKGQSEPAKRDAHDMIVDGDIGGPAKRARNDAAPPVAAAAAAAASPAGILSNKRLQYEEEDADSDSSVDEMVDELKRVMKDNDKRKKRAAKVELTETRKEVDGKVEAFRQKYEQKSEHFEKQTQDNAATAQQAQAKMKELKKQRELNAKESKDLGRQFDKAQEEFDESFDELMQICRHAPPEFKKKHDEFIQRAKHEVDSKVGDLHKRVDKLHNKKELRMLLGAVIGQLQDDDEESGES